MEPLPNQSPDSQRPRLALVLILALLAAAGVGLWAFVGNKPTPDLAASADADAPEAQPDAAQEVPAGGNAPEPTLAVSPREHAPHQRRAPSAQAQPLAPSSTLPPLPPASAQSQQIIQRLAQFDPRQVAITPEQGAELRRNLQDLLGQGSAAFPAIQQFLDNNQDLTFEDAGGTNQVGYTSLRGALFDVARQIGGQGATDLFLNTLRDTADPGEIAAMARYLEEQAPGQYRQEIVGAARETLNQAASGEVQVREAAPLFQVLQNYGDAATAADLASAAPQWQYYANMALAGMNEGQGVRALVQNAQESAQSGKATTTFALQMLAQVAGQQPEAAAALVEQARQNQISDRAWVKVVEGLAGDQYHLGKPPSDPANPSAPMSGLKTYHIESGNQNYYSLPFNLYGTPEQAAQRLAIVDQLLSTTQNPAAVEALRNARAVLSAPAPQ